MNNVINTVLREDNKLYVNLHGIQKTVYLKYPLSVDSDDTKKRFKEPVQVEIWCHNYKVKYFVDGYNLNHVIYVKM